MTQMLLGGGGFNLPPALSLETLYKQQGAGPRAGSKGQVAAAKKGEWSGGGGHETLALRLVPPAAVGRPSGPASPASVWSGPGTQTSFGWPLPSCGFSPCALCCHLSLSGQPGRDRRSKAVEGPACGRRPLPPAARCPHPGTAP